MIYLIGGVPRVGKSTLSQRILETKRIPWVSLDMIRDMLFEAAPQLKLQEGKDWWDTIPDKFYPFLKELVKDAARSSVEYVFEGDVFRPKHVIELRKEFPVQACFLGTSNTTVAILKENPGVQDWLGELSEEGLREFPAWLIKKSEMFEVACRKHTLPYFDTGVRHEDALQAAYDSLFGAA